MKQLEVNWNERMVELQNRGYIEKKVLNLKV